MSSMLLVFFCFFLLLFFFSIQFNSMFGFGSLFNFTGFCSYSEALLWFCYQSKFVKRVSLPRGG